MKRAEHGLGADWMDVTVPALDEDGDPSTETWRVPLNFLVSNWTCLFGDGCPGLFGKHESRTTPDIGCCTNSFWFDDVGDLEHVTKMVAELTDDDWDSELRSHVDKHGWKNIYSINEEEGTVNGKGKVHDGGCVFANRADGSVGSTGKIGCAFHHLGQRTGRTNHTEIMPWVCWQLPFKYDWDDTDEINILSPWDVDAWGGIDADGSHDSWCSYWCVDTPDAYVGKEPVYRGMEAELRMLMGDDVYDQMVRQIVARTPANIPPMPGQVRNDGRPLLPVLVGQRTPKRTPDMRK